MCSSWSHSEHLLTPALSPFGARVQSHAVWRRLFIVLMKAAHISPNIFSLRMFLSNVLYNNCFLYYMIIACTHIIHHIHTYIYICYFVYLIRIFISSSLHGRLAALGSLCLIHYPLHFLGRYRWFAQWQATRYCLS